MTDDNCETPPARCPSCGDRLLGFTAGDYVAHLAGHDDLAGRVARDMVDPEADGGGER